MKRNAILLVVTAVVFAGLGAYLGMEAPTGVTPPHGTSSVVASTAATGAPASNSTTSSATTALFAQSMAGPDGSMQRLDKWKGQPVVVNFWATWCSPCVEEMPELSALQKEIAPKNVQIIGIGIDTPANIREFATKYSIAYPLYVAGMSGTELTRQFGNKAGGLPYTVLIDAEGRIAKTYLGRLKMDELRRDVAALRPKT